MGDSVSLKRLEFWTAAIALLAAIVAGTNEIISQINIVKAAVLPKPLEGIWDYSMTYDYFHGEQGLWSANGKGIIMWRQDNIRYEIYLGAHVTPANETSPVLAGFTRGFIEADDAGWPTPPFKMENIRYISRLHKNDKQQVVPVFYYENCKYNRTNDRPDTITCYFESKNPAEQIYSRGKAEFKWESRLH